MREPEIECDLVRIIRARLIFIRNVAHIVAHSFTCATSSGSSWKTSSSEISSGISWARLRLSYDACVRRH